MDRIGPRRAVSRSVQILSAEVLPDSEKSVPLAGRLGAPGPGQRIVDARMPRLRDSCGNPPELFSRSVCVSTFQVDLENSDFT